jgi:hypothetical protein
VGGLILLIAAVRPVALAGATLSALAGAWFALGTILSQLWASAGTGSAGMAVGGTAARVLEQIGFFTGLGVAIAFLAGAAIGRLMVVTVRDSRHAERRAERRAALAGTAAGAEPTAPAPRQPA